MDINEIVLNGVVEIDGDIDKDLEYALMFDRVQNNQGKIKSWTDADGNERKTYTMVNLGIVALKAGDKAIKGKAKRTTQSQVLRWKIEELYRQEYVDGEDFKDSEAYYKSYMSKLIDSVEDKLI